MVSAESLGLWLRRNHSTSIGAPITTGLKARSFAHRRMAAVGADDQVGADLLGPALDRGAHADDAAALLDQASRLGMHQRA